jgi:hypothetical protein
MILDAAETVLGYFGFDRSLYANKKNVVHRRIVCEIAEFLYNCPPIYFLLLLHALLFFANINWILHHYEVYLHDLRNPLC